MDKKSEFAYKISHPIDWPEIIKQLCQENEIPWPMPTIGRVKVWVDVEQVELCRQKKN